ncbi:MULTISPECIES: GNAT family N-acetyltransferase [unclassified Phyllobacterium]|uniref:GNAT family N-acetyltransferase n=1 Tax=unclassified Phyllobacterium TaxID=2638441 RepID=UPI003012D355
MTQETQTSIFSSQGDPERIETPRLILRQPVYSDASGLHALLSDPVTCHFSPFRPFTDADTHFAIVEWREARDRGLRTYVGANRSDPRVPIGFIQVGPDEELGGLMSPKQSGRGLATEAMQAIITALELRHAWTIIDAEHAALIHTLEKVNIKQQRILPAHRVHPQISLEKRDCVLLHQEADHQMEPDSQLARKAPSGEHAKHR